MSKNNTKLDTAVKLTKVARDLAVIWGILVASRMAILWTNDIFGLTVN